MLVLLLACATHAPPEGVKTHGNLPILTESELAAENAARDTCLAGCAEQPDADECRAACEAKWPIRQVEVVPDALVAPAAP